VSDLQFDVDTASRVFCNPEAYANEAYWHAATEFLRDEHPVPRVEVEGFPAFWAATRYDDVMAVERDLAGWLATAMPILRTGPEEAQSPVRSLVQMDPPVHTQYRKISADWFKPARIAEL
jgi:cytochrome P450